MLESGSLRLIRRSLSPRHSAWTRVLGLALLSIGCQKKPLPASSAQAARSVGSDAAGRETVGVTVYNQNFGVVREARRVALGEGRIELSFADVAAQIQPETVHIRSLGAADDLAVLEQNYRYDLLSPETLLKKYLGRTIKVYRSNERLGTEEERSAEVLAVEQGVVLRIDGQVTTGIPGRLAFPEVPENLLAKPTLVWLVDSKAREQRLELTYLTRGINWSADYVFVLSPDDARGDLTGWVTLVNESGTSYDNAELKLVAGEVQRIQPPAAPAMEIMEEATKPAGPPAPQFKEEGLFEYHLYTLRRPTTLRDKESKQVSLLEAHDVGLQKKLIFYGAAYYYRGQHGQVISNQKVGVYLDFKNEEKNHLGAPLPKGVVRVYKADHGGAKQFVGEDTIDHTPRDEKIRIKLGEAFDVVGDRKQMRYVNFGGCVSESHWEIELRNHKDKAEQVEIYEPVGGDWEIMESSHPARREDAHTFVFDVSVPARGKTKVTYRVKIRWC